MKKILTSILLLVTMSTVLADGSCSPAAVLWDQPSSATQSGTIGASQHFPIVEGGLYSSDDFKSDSWCIESIFVPGSPTSTSLADAQNLTWIIYPDADGHPAGYPGDGSGKEYWSFTVAPSNSAVALTGLGLQQVTLDVVAATGNPVHLPAGVYWLVFFPAFGNQVYSLKWFWAASASTTNLAVASFIDPTNLFGEGYTSWTPWSTIYSGSHDLAFRLEGTVCGVPIGEGPVGGFIEPVNTLAIATPYLLLFVTIVAVTVIVCKNPESD